MSDDTKALATYDEELAAAAAEATAQEDGIARGRFFSLRGGSLSIGDDEIPGGEIIAIILDSRIENTYYPGAYDPDARSGPRCYAFGRTDKEVAPNPLWVAEPVCSACADCEKNNWGAKGEAKECRNRRRLAVIQAGSIGKAGIELADPASLETAEIAFITLPPTQLSSWAKYVRQIATVLHRPPFGVVTRIKVVPDRKTILRVAFTLVGPVSSDALPAVMARHKEAAESIEFPYRDAPIEASEEAGDGRRKAKY